MDNKKINLLIRKSTMYNENTLNFMRNKIKDIITRKIEGDIVECGVWMGGCSAAIAQTLLAHKDERVLHLFDSFDDICEPLPIDGKKLIKQVGGIKNAQGRLRPVKGFYKKRKLSGPGNEKHVHDLLTKIVGYPKEKVKIHKGWFQNTMVPCSKEIEKIALLFLDCDLYISIKLCLENLYSKLSKGGIIMIDDYNNYSGCKKAVDDFLKEQKIHVKFNTVDLACWIKK